MQLESVICVRQITVLLACEVIEILSFLPEDPRALPSQFRLRSLCAGSNNVPQFILLQLGYLETVFKELEIRVKLGEYGYGIFMIRVTFYLQLTVYDDLRPSQTSVKLSDGLYGAWNLLVLAFRIVLDAFLDETGGVLGADYLKPDKDCLF